MGVREPGIVHAAALRESLLSLTTLCNVLVCRAVFTMLLIATTGITFSLNLVGLVYNVRFA
jgi:hypothetical protein